MNAIELSIFAARIEAICEEMGAQLRRAAFSPNIKDRLDFSCAIFDVQGQLCAQAAHIPVHLGSMAYAMQDIVQQFEWADGDTMILNDPYKGGTHLPDVTVITPAFIEGQLAGFVANRAHHADIGSESPGSMPISQHLSEEGLLLPPTFLYRQGQRDDNVWQSLLTSTRNAAESAGDFNAQISANRRGLTRLIELIEPMGLAAYQQALVGINDYAERLALAALQNIPDGEYQYMDYMDDDGVAAQSIVIAVSIQVRSGRVLVDFAGTAAQVAGNINCPLSVAAAAVFYVFRCLMPEQTPACAGAFRLIELQAPLGCLVNARSPAAVAAGNVETSTRIVDVVIGALVSALPQLMPAASHGSMNNVALGSIKADEGATAGSAWDYYETIGGGTGAGMQQPGISAVQTHMTNTLNTPIEVLESKYPIRISHYGIRRGSGGAGAQTGGDGIIREYTFLSPAAGTLITERRQLAPWGLAGAAAGQSGRNLLNGKVLPAKTSFEVQAGDKLRVETPGGGGYGQPG